MSQLAITPNVKILMVFQSRSPKITPSPPLPRTKSNYCNSPMFSHQVLRSLVHVNVGRGPGSPFIPGSGDVQFCSLTTRIEKTCKNTMAQWSVLLGSLARLSPTNQMAMLQPRPKWQRKSQKSLGADWITNSLNCSDFCR